MNNNSISRNRFIVDECDLELSDDTGQWSKDFFESDIDEEDLNLLNEGANEMMNAIMRLRKNRPDTKL